MVRIVRIPFLHAQLTGFGRGVHANWMRGASRILEEARPEGRAVELCSIDWLRWVSVMGNEENRSYEAAGSAVSSCRSRPSIPCSQQNDDHRNPTHSAEQ
jgi:hypothetical protein